MSFRTNRLPANGPGRVAHGNFVLSELTLEVASKPDFSDAQRIEFATAKADFEQADRPWACQRMYSTETITPDGRLLRSMARRPLARRRHLKQPLDLTQQHVSFGSRLSHQYGQQHTIGRFKLSLQTGLVEPDVDPCPKRLSRL